MTQDDEMSGKGESGNNKAMAFRSLCAAAGVLPSTVAFIGGGKMANALVNGLLRSGILSKADIAVSVKSDDSIPHWKSQGIINVYTDNNRMLRDYGKGIVVLSVKPVSRTTVFDSLDKDALRKTSLIVSVMGGVKLATLENDALSRGYASGVVRLMTNTSASVGSAASVICSAPQLHPSKKKVAAAFAKAVGLCLEIEERCFDAASAIAGCAPAFMYTAIDAMADGGVLGGLDRTTALTLAAQITMGAGRMILESKEHPGKLKDDICSPGGTTICGLRELDRHGMRSAFIEAVDASTKRSAQL